MKGVDSSSQNFNLFDAAVRQSELSLSGYKSYIGKTIHTKTLGDVYITESGLLAAAHLNGFAAVEEFLRSGGSIDRMDGHNIHVSEYLAQFSGYNFTFDLKTGNFADTPNSAATDKIVGAERAKAIAFRAAHRSGIVHRGHHRRYVKPRGAVRSFLPHGGSKKLSATRGSRQAGDLGPEPAFPAAQRRSFTLNMQRGGGCLLGSLKRMPPSSPGYFGSHLAMDRPTAPDKLAGLASRPDARALSVQHGRFPVPRPAKFTIASRSGQDIPSFAPPGGRESGFSGNSDEVTMLQQRDMAADGWGGAGSRAGMNNSAESEFRNSLVRGGAMDQRPAFGTALEEYFMRQARLPPSGGSGFDPRLTPAWPSLKLPV